MSREAVTTLNNRIIAALRLSSNNSSSNYSTGSCSCLFKPREYSLAKSLQALEQQAQKFIKENIETVNPIYARLNEKATNPAFENIKSVNKPLGENEYRIWILRSDFVLATGIKNAYKLWFGYTGLEDAFEESLHAHIGFDDRYGHPSLTHKHPGYDGSSYYAGYVTKRLASDGTSKLEILLFSGRYYRNDLLPEEIKLLEAYISLQFIAAYGTNSVDFIDISNYRDYFDLSLYLHNGNFPQSIYTRREYCINSIVEIIQSHGNYTRDYSDKRICIACP